MRTLLISFMMASSALAHDAPTGWSYPANCCSNYDCREIPAEDVKEVWNGYHMTKSKLHEIVPYQSGMVKDSPDGAFHWCTQGGTDAGKTICLFVPPRSF